MATIFGDTPGDVSRNQALLQNNPTARAIAAMQLLQSVGNQGALRSGQASAERIAAQTAANEAERLRNALTLGREQLTSQEKIAKLGGGFSKEIAQINFEGMKLPYTDRVMEHQLALARINSSRLDPRMAGDAMAQNYDASKLNLAAKIAANEANNLLKPALETKMSKRWFNGLTGPLTELEIGDVLTGIKSHPNLGLGKDQIFFNPKSKQFEAIEIPPTTFNVPGNGLSVPTAPPNANQLMQLDNPLMGVPPLPAVPPLPVGVPMGVPRIEPAWDNPTGGMAVPVVPPVAAAIAPMAVPRVAPGYAPRRVPNPQELVDFANRAANQKAVEAATLEAMRRASQRYAPTGAVAVPVAPTPSRRSGGASGAWEQVFNSEAEARAAGVQPGQEFILIQNGERWRARLR